MVFSVVSHWRRGDMVQSWATDTAKAHVQAEETESPDSFFCASI